MPCYEPEFPIRVVPTPHSKLEKSQWRFIPGEHSRLAGVLLFGWEERIDINVLSPEVSSPADRKDEFRGINQTSLSNGWVIAGRPIPTRQPQVTPKNGSSLRPVFYAKGERELANEWRKVLDWLDLPDSA